MTTHTELMHAVLDGEADEAQAQALKRLLAADPAARAEFDALKQLFSELDGVPQRHPPEGLFAGVMAAVDARQSSRRSQQPQLSFLSRVFGPSPRDLVSRTPNLSKHFNRSMDMSSKSSSPFTSGTFWIGGATAAAALLVWQFGFNSWPVEKDVMGTIAPAERYRAPQPGAADIKVGAPAGGQAIQTGALAPAESAQKVAGDKQSGDSAVAERVMEKTAVEKTTTEKSKTESQTTEAAVTERVRTDKAAQSVVADRAVVEKTVAADRANVEKAATAVAAERAVMKAPAAAATGKQVQ